MALGDSSIGISQLCVESPRNPFMSDPHDLVCVYKASNPAKAELVRNLLVAEGIRAETADTHNPFPGLSTMPSEVYVEQSNEVEARAVIADAEKNHIEDDSEDDLDESGEEFAEESSPV